MPIGSGRQKKERADFDWPAYLEKMENDPRRHVQIIGYYLKRRGTQFTNEEQVHEAIKRHSRDAVKLVHFDDEQIIRGCDEAEFNVPAEWTLQTALKYITK